MKLIKLSEYAKQNGIGYRAAWNRFNAGKIPNAVVSEVGTIFVNIEEQTTKEEFNVVYARVSTSDQKKDLDKQVERIVQFANSKGIEIHKVYKEIASGLNDNRPKLNELLSNNKITNIIIENKDRLTRFGYNYIQTLVKQNGGNIIIMNTLDNDKDDIIQDFVSVITSFCARIYSKRRNKTNVEKIIKELELENKD